MEKRIAIPECIRPSVPEARVAGNVGPHPRVGAAIQLRRRQGVNSEKKTEEHASQKPFECKHRTRAELTDFARADPPDIPKIGAFVYERKLPVMEESIPRRTINLAGTIGEVSEVFGVKLQRPRGARRKCGGRHAFFET